MSDRVRRVVIVAAAIVFLAAAIRHFHWLGGPYFEIPETIQDHVWPTPFPSRDAIVLSRRAEPLLPRGATVTIVLPTEAPDYDQTHWLTALGMLPRQHAVPQKLDGPREKLPQFVIAIHEPLEHPHYELVHTFPEGHLYRRRE
jgi:hypothetical protein